MFYSSYRYEIAFVCFNDGFGYRSCSYTIPSYTRHTILTYQFKFNYVAAVNASCRRATS